MKRGVLEICDYWIGSACSNESVSTQAIQAQNTPNPLLKMVSDHRISITASPSRNVVHSSITPHESHASPHACYCLAGHVQFLDIIHA